MFFFLVFILGHSTEGVNTIINNWKMKEVHHGIITDPGHKLYGQKKLRKKLRKTKKTEEHMGNCKLIEATKCNLWQFGS